MNKSVYEGHTQRRSLNFRFNIAKIEFNLAPFQAVWCFSSFVLNNDLILF